ncbi:MAG: lytic transglycosylase domain-containing protein, partial [Acidobacteriota bacterium]
AGLWEPAIEVFNQTYQSGPMGNFGGPGLLGGLRLTGRRDRQDESLQIYEVLRRTPTARSELGRAALFLAATDIVEGRSDRAGRWLDDADTAIRGTSLEIDYWRGRLAEIEGRPAEALERYLRALRRDFFHPLSQQARLRLESPAMRRQVEQRLRLRLSRGDRPVEALVLLERDDPNRTRVIEVLQQKLAAENRGRDIAPSKTMPVGDWPIFTSPLVHPEETLLALGIFSDGASAASKHFPMSEPPLALAAAEQLVRGGLPREGLLIAEILQRRIPASFPQAALPTAFREVLFPLPYREILDRATSRFRLDPSILAGIIREESRWQATAVSAASARGLTQFVIPTAERIARKIGLGRIVPADLERPEVSILLGAAYVDELRTAYDGAVHQAIAAYNAGESQSQLWRRYCASDDPAEYYTKVAFGETRKYLGRVLTSAAQYRDLYY